MKWLAWGWQIVEGTKKPCVIGEIQGQANAHAALRLARLRYGKMAVDRVQSAMSREIDLREAPDKLLFKRHRPRPYKHKQKKKSGPFGETLN